MRFLPIGIATVLVSAALPVGAQEDIRFPSTVYAERRARLARSMGDSVVIVVPGRHLVGNHELPRQDPNFWYLTGVESPYALLVIAPGGRTVLFLPDSFEFAGAQYPMLDSAFRRAPWNRAPQRLAPGTARAK